MRFEILPDPPCVFRGDGSKAVLVGLSARQRLLLRLFISAGGKPVDPDDIKRAVGANETYRAIHKIRQVTAGCRPPVYDRALGTSASGVRKSADVSMVITESVGGRTRYRFVVQADDEVDWPACRAEIARASQLWSQGDRDASVALANKWRDGLLDSNLSDALSDLDTSIWTEIESRAFKECRWQLIRLLALHASAQGAHTVALEHIDQILDEADRDLAVYDESLAEAAVKARWLMQASQQTAFATVSRYFDDCNLTYSAQISEFYDDVAGTDYDTASRKWMSKWAVPAVRAGVMVGSPVGTGGGIAKLLRTEPHRALPDVLTPGLTSAALQATMSTSMGDEIAKRLVAISKAATEAVENGDFASQERIGRELVILGESEPSLTAPGHYFIAEGLRLQADHAVGDVRSSLLDRASTEYEVAREFDPTSVRAIRGLARTYEVLGDQPTAVNLFQLAYGMTRQQLAELSSLPPDLRFELSHEALRVTRHHVHVLGGLRMSDPVAARIAGVDDVLLHRLSAESGALHRERLPMFEASSRWTQIEWFMGLSFLAKSYAAIGDDSTALVELASALYARRQMIEPGRELTGVELSNLRWWLSIAKTLRREHPDGLPTALDNLEATLAAGDAGSILGAVDAILVVVRSILPPRF